MIQVRPATREDHGFIVQAQLDMAWKTESYRLDRETVSLGAEAVFADATKGAYWVAQWEDDAAGSERYVFGYC